MLHFPTLIALEGILLLAQLAGGLAGAQAEPEQTLRRAMELQQAGDLEGAIEQYQAFLAQHPEAAEARVNLGNAYASIGHYQDAIIQYEQALENGGLRDPIGTNYALGRVYFQMAEFEKARHVLVQVVAERSKDKEAVQLLASCYFNLGEWQKVIDLISPLESELGESPALTYLLGSALLEGGQVERGTPLAETALKDTEWAEARFRLEARSDWLRSRGEINGSRVESAEHFP